MPGMFPPSPLSAMPSMSNTDQSTTIVTPTLNQSGGTNYMEGQTAKDLLPWMSGAGGMSSYLPILVVGIVALVAWKVLKK